MQITVTMEISEYVWDEYGAREAIERAAYQLHLAAVRNRFDSPIDTDEMRPIKRTVYNYNGDKCATIVVAE